MRSGRTGVGDLAEFTLTSGERAAGIWSQTPASRSAARGYIPGSCSAAGQPARVNVGPEESNSAWFTAIPAHEGVGDE